MMENAVALPPCRLLWQITNPFVPYQRLRAKLYHGSPNARFWKVTIFPGHRSLEEWHFSFLLKYVESDESERVFRAERIRVNISLRGRYMDSKDELNYEFNPQNHYTYRFESSVGSPGSVESYELNIEVVIAFRAQPIEELRPRGFLWSTPADLEDLSVSMLRLFDESPLSDMLLESTLNVLPVHYCVLAARWKGFLDEHHLTEPPGDAVQTNISHAVLSGILIYIYSGRHVDIAFNFWNLAFTTEMFQVIDRYRIYHLYKVFVTNDSEQRRLTVRNMTGFSKRFPLDGNVGPHTWEVGRNDPYRINFQINFLMNGDAPRFSYSLRMVTGPRCFVLVTLQFLQKIKFRGDPRPRNNFWKVHQHDYTIEPRGVAQSDILPFEGRELRMEYIRRGRHQIGRREFSYYIRCVLNLSDGTESVVVETTGINVWTQDQERFHVLSDDLYRLRRDPANADLCVMCPDGHSHFVHKAILAARVPQWGELFAIHGGDPQEVADTEVPSLVLGHILDYMYTGKTFRIPTDLFNEIEQFAVTGGFVSLQRFIEALRRALPV